MELAAPADNKAAPVAKISLATNIQDFNCKDEITSPLDAQKQGGWYTMGAVEPHKLIPLADGSLVSNRDCQIYPEETEILPKPVLRSDGKESDLSHPPLHIWRAQQAMLKLTKSGTSGTEQPREQSCTMASTQTWDEIGLDGAGAEEQQWWTCAKGCGFKRLDFVTVSQHEAICEGPSAEAELSEETIKAREAKKQAAAAPVAATLRGSDVLLAEYIARPKRPALPALIKTKGKRTLSKVDFFPSTMQTSWEMLHGMLNEWKTENPGDKVLNVETLELELPEIPMYRAYLPGPRGHTEFKVRCLRAWVLTEGVPRFTQGFAAGSIRSARVPEGTTENELSTIAAAPEQFSVRRVPESNSPGAFQELFEVYLDRFQSVLIVVALFFAICVAFVKL